MIYTFHNMIQDCLRRDAQAWREFVTRYLPLARHFLLHYFPGAAGDADRMLAQIFGGTLDSEGHFFRSFNGRAERELMVHFRQFVIERAHALAPPPASAPPVSQEVLEAAFKDFSALQRQVVWLYTMGYPPEKLAPILNMKAETAAEITKAAQEKLRGAMDSWSEDSLRSSLRALVESVSVQESKDCYPYLTFHRIVDGQVTWQDRDQALAHLTRCFRCVDRFCVFQEVVYFSRKLPEATPAEIEAVLSSLNLPAPAKKKSLLGKLFG